MNSEEFRLYCLSKKGVTECLPFDDTTLVFKVMGKMFALLSLDANPTTNLKCDPEWAISLREEHPEITPGYHMNKKHWNTVDLSGNLKPNFICELTDHSYTLVVNSLTRKLKDELNNIR
jgi:predicted DNA-binding protein (MmcQ/YjbR family)